MAMGGQSSQSTQPDMQKGGWKVQEADFKPPKIIYGTMRIADVLGWIGDRKQVPAQQSGKGMGGGGAGGGQNNYTESLIAFLCEGTIAGIGRGWRSSSASAVIKPKLLLNKWSFVLGALGQAPLSYFTSNHPGMDLGYSGLAYGFRANQNLGTSTTPPQFSFETFGKFIDTLHNGAQISYADPTPLAVTAATQLGNLATFTTSVAHNYFTGQTVVVSGVTPAGYNGTWAVTGTPTATTFTAELAASGLGAASAFGAVTGGTIISGCSNPDANPADIIPDLLTNLQYGAFWDPSLVGDYTTFGEYCAANNLFLSLALDSATKVSDTLSQIATLCNADYRLHDGLLTIVPFGDLPQTANGVTFTPDLSPVYTFTDDDFQDPPETSITRSADMFNRFRIEFLNRANNYDPETIYAEIADQIELYGMRAGDTLTAHEVANPLTARLIATTQMQRSVSVIREYTFKVGWQYFMLEPLDIVGIVDTRQGIGAGVAMATALGTDGGGAFIRLGAGVSTVPLAGEWVVDKANNVKSQIVTPAAGFANSLTKVYVADTTQMSAGDTMAVAPLRVRVNTIDEDQDDKKLAIAAEDLGVNTPTIYAPPAQPRGGNVAGPADTEPTSVNAPYIFEPNYTLAISALAQGEIWIGASGSTVHDANWGGCLVYFSEDNLSYDYIGTITTPATMGALYGNLSDVGTDLQVDLSESDGVVSSISTTLADNFYNLAVLDTGAGLEMLSFATVAAGPGQNQYDCTYLVRGAYLTTVGSHAIGAPFVVLGQPHAIDPAIFRFKYPKADIGKTVYFKFASFGPGGGSPEDVADVAAYSYTPTGGSLAPLNNNGVTEDGYVNSDGLAAQSVGITDLTPVIGPVSIANGPGFVLVASLPLSITTAIGDYLSLLANLQLDATVFGGQMVNLKWKGHDTGTVYAVRHQLYVDIDGNLDDSLDKLAANVDTALDLYVEQFTGGAGDVTGGGLTVTNTQQR